MITIYQKASCTTCKKVLSILKEKNIDFSAVEYYKEPLTKSKLTDLLYKLNLSPADLVRTKESIYKELQLGQKHHSDEEWLDLLVKYPDLIQRPIVENGSKAILARPPERIFEIL